MWMAALAAFAGAFGKGLNQREQIKAQNRIAEANADARNITRAGDAKLASAVGNLQRYRQSVSNQRTLKQAALKQESIRTNLMRVRADAQSASLQTRLDAASQAGAAAAAFSAAGVGGGTRDMVNQTIRTSRQRKLDAIDKKAGQYEYDALRQLTNINEDVGFRLDNSLIIDQINYREANADIDKQEVPSVWRTVFNSALSAASSPGGQAALSNMGGGGYSFRFQNSYGASGSGTSAGTFAG